MEEIIKYLIEKNKQPEKLAKRNAEKLCKYEDIQNEFKEWIKTEQYQEDGISIDGYTAMQISKMAPFMNGVGVYNFMVSLRDNPEFAHDMILKNFPRK